MIDLSKEFGFQWEDWLRALATGYGMIAVILIQRFAVNLRQDWVGSINLEVLWDISFFLPRLIVFAMTAFLLLVRHKMAYVFFGLSSGIILWMLIRLLTGAYSESSLWGQCVTGVWFWALLGWGTVYMASPKTRRLFVPAREVFESK